ncbi:ALF repeat-containing protein [Streptomyces sp. NPDC039022]|uniref:ALF repeat-containing protein n=1 Tax=Streptomyces sp. NPDC039022 TaxID=3157091 RepID=UPI003411F5E5
MVSQYTAHAERALTDGTPEAIHWFLVTGRHIARARGEEKATIDQPPPLDS